jgi:hypothetical protein
VLPLLRAYHPPGVALAMYPPLLHPGVWFAVQVVLPFALVAVISTALMSPPEIGGSIVGSNALNNSNLANVVPWFGRGPPLIRLFPCRTGTFGLR